MTNVFNFFVFLKEVPLEQLFFLALCCFTHTHEKKFQINILVVSVITFFKLNVERAGLPRNKAKT